MDTSKINELRNELLERINSKSKVQLEKVDRYINLVQIYYALDGAIDEFGIMITTINGSQEFTKPNPAIAEKNKINTSLIALGKDLGLDVPLPVSNAEDSESDLI